MSIAPNIMQARKVFAVNVTATDQVIEPGPALIKNNQGTGADITVLLEGDKDNESLKQTIYFAAGEVLNAKVFKVYKAGTTSGNIMAFTN